MDSTLQIHGLPCIRPPQGQVCRVGKARSLPHLPLWPAIHRTEQAFVRAPVVDHMHIVTTWDTVEKINIELYSRWVAATPNHAPRPGPP